MNLAILKFIFCACLACGSLILYYFVNEKPWRDKLFKFLVCGGYLARLFIAIYVYSVKLPFTLTSDASIFYLPQVIDLLSGKMPHQDFSSSYSLLFLPLISLPVMIWRSVGAIVITMILLEAATLAIYLLRCKKTKATYGWAVAFLYSFCPVSFYWIGIVGHNGSIIALGVMAGLIWAEQGKDYLAGISAALSFVCAKLLAVLFWPAIVFFRFGGRIKRASMVAASILFTLIFMVFGIDSLSPITNEFNNYSSGNIWFALSRFFPPFIGCALWNVLPLVLFAGIFLVVFGFFIRSQKLELVNNFDLAAAFVALANLLFLLLSKKSNTFYLTMTLLLLIHVFVRNRQETLKRLIPLAYVGSITTIELFLWHDPSFSENTVYSLRGLVFLTMEGSLLACYIYWIVACFKAIILPNRSSEINLQSC